jgi:hypothetical protein
MLNFLKKKEKSPIVPDARSVYAFMKHRRGEFLLFLNQDGDDVLNFMQLPDRYPVALTLSEFTAGLVDSIFEFVEVLPEEVFDVCKVNINNLTKV